MICSFFWGGRWMSWGTCAEQRWGALVLFVLSPQQQTKLLPTRSCFWEVPGKQRLAGEDNPTSQYLKNFLQTTRARKPSPNLGYVPRCSTRAFWAGRTNSWWKTKLLFKSCRLNTNSQSLKHQFRRELDVGWWLFQAISSILSWTPRGVAQTRETQQEEEDGARISA